MYVVVITVHGLLVGPFDTDKDAAQWAKRHLHSTVQWYTRILIPGETHA